MTVPLFTDDIPEKVRHVVQALYQINEWPQDWGKDVQLVKRMMSVYPNADHLGEAMHFVTWFEGWREKHPRKQVNHRARWANWIKNSKRFAARRPSGPAPKEAHGETGVEGWG